MYYDSKARVVAHFLSIVENYLSFVLSRGDGTLPQRLVHYFNFISSCYRHSLGGLEPRPDWNLSEYRCAYISRFHVLHAYMVYESLCGSLLAGSGQLLCSLRTSWRSKSELKLCCLGGGPGSDVIGLIQFLRDYDMFPAYRLQCDIFDKFQQWESSWADLLHANPALSSLVRTEYHNIDLTYTLLTLDKAPRIVREADIFTAVKFFSSVSAFIRNDSARGHPLRAIFRLMKPGALVLYIDNQNLRQECEFKELASLSGTILEVLFAWHGEMAVPFLDSLNLSSCFPATGVMSNQGLSPLDRVSVSVVLFCKRVTTNHGSAFPCPTTSSLDHCTDPGRETLGPRFMSQRNRPAHVQVETRYACDATHKPSQQNASAAKESQAGITPQVYAQGHQTSSSRQTPSNCCICFCLVLFVLLNLFCSFIKSN